MSWKIIRKNITSLGLSEGEQIQFLQMKFQPPRKTAEAGDDFQTPQVIISQREQNKGKQPEVDIAKRDKPKDHPPATVHSKKGRKNASIFFNSIKDELYSQPKCIKAPISTGSQHNVKVVTFMNRRDKKETKGKDAPDKDSKRSIDSEENENGRTFDFERARLEVHKFGIAGYKKEKQRKFEQERAIMLGAKPLKREYVSYKVYQKRQKEMDQAKNEKRMMESSFEPVKKKRKPGQKDRNLRKTNGLSGNASDGQVGRFRGGALILSSKDIQKIKQSKTPK